MTNGKARHGNLRGGFATVGLLILSIIVATLVSCLRFQDTTEEPRNIQGVHELHKMSEYTGINSEISGGFFLFFGGISGQTKSETLVRFAWKMNDGTYAISTLPIEKIRVKFDNNVTTPTVDFDSGKIRYEWENNSDLEYVINHYVNYAILTVRESDWPSQINLPFNNK